jgi:hypothetical protein
MRNRETLKKVWIIISAIAILSMVALTMSALFVQ